VKLRLRRQTVSNLKQKCETTCLAGLTWFANINNPQTHGTYKTDVEKWDGLYRVLAKYADKVDTAGDGFGPHALRATALTSALDYNADLEKVQVWVGHPNASTTRMYGRRQARSENSPNYSYARKTIQISRAGSN
jgi:integrase